MGYINIRTKLFLLILIGLVPLISLQAVRIHNYSKDKIETELRGAQDLAEAISSSFLNYVEEVWSQELALSTYFTINPDLSPGDIQLYLSEAAKNQKTAITFSWIDPEGFVIGSTNQKLIGKSMVECEYVIRVQNGEEKVLSDLVISHTTNEPAIPIVRAIKKDGKLIGMISAVIDVEKLSMRLPLTNVNTGSRFGLVDRNGMVVFTSDIKKIPYNNRLLHENSSAWRSLKGEVIKTYSMKSSFDGSIRMGIDYPIKEIGWACFVSSTIDSIMEKHNQVTQKHIVILTLVSLISIISAFLLGNRILQPINILKNAANMMVNGDYSVRTNITGYDEIASTAQAFDRMAEGIEQYDKLKTQFFSNVSHELKTPLNVIYATSQLLYNIPPGTNYDEYHSKLQKHLNIIKQNCYRLMRLISNLIDITRYDSGFLNMKLGNYNIVYLVEEITMSVVRYAEVKGINIVFDTDVEEKVIACDPDMVERIILNLISNALKFTHEGGSVTINIYDKQENVIISVRDTGIGIAQDKLGIIFERFRQVDNTLTKSREGSGIGLSLVKALVESHKGKISVASEPGKGTEFIIEFPAYIIHELNTSEQQLPVDNTQSIVERINIEFSDIYSTGNSI
mgnify:CR=1 FL=1